MKIICVLKSGGCFGPEYSDKLFDSIARNTTKDFEFICLTDMVFSADYARIPLKHNYKGWWSKIEMFMYDGPVLTIDLDMVILRNIDPILELPDSLDDNEIFLVKALHPPRDFTTSIMIWNGDLSYVYNQFEYKKHTAYRWDQFYVVDTLKKNNATIYPIKESHGVYSFKKQWRPTKPDDARILWFHGSPRPHECNNEMVKKHWRKNVPQI